MQNTSEKETYKPHKFLIAEALACISFILNTICVMTGKEKMGPVSPAWLPHFGLIYWLKTTLAIIGIIYFFTSGVFTVKKNSRYISFFTIVILWYSIPIINSLLTFPLDTIFSLESLAHNQGTTFQSRIPTQIIWSFPAFLVAIDLLKRLVKTKL